MAAPAKIRGAVPKTIAAAKVIAREKIGIGAETSEPIFEEKGRGFPEISMPIISRKVTPLMLVFDMRCSVAWYRDVLGFEVLQSHEPDGHLHWAMLKLGEAALMLNSKYENDMKMEARPMHMEGHGDLTLYFDCPNVDEAYEHLLAKGCEVVKPVTRYYGMKQVTVIDPDGYELCFQQPVK